MKVLIIDPWCSDKYEVYTIGLCDGLSNYADVTLCSSYYETRISNKYDIKRVFFRYSDRMKRSALRSVVRGIEYCLNYLKIIKLAKKHQFDVIHVEWALLHTADRLFLKKLKKLTKRLVYTAHNAIPHINGESHVADLKKLHECFDTIIVHGESIREEYLHYFPEDAEKLKIQRHGVHLSQQDTYDKSLVSEDIYQFATEKKGKLCVVVGNIFYNKGTDRPIRYWLTNKIGSEDRLIVAGDYSNKYEELEALMSELPKTSNILFLPRFLNKDEFTFVVGQSDFVVIPYRHASMSGIVYSAAALRKPIVYTNTGAIAEYIGSDCGYCVDNDDIALDKAMTHMLSLTKEQLSRMGSNHHQCIYTNYSWSNIAEQLVRVVYRGEE